MENTGTFYQEERCSASLGELRCAERAMEVLKNKLIPAHLEDLKKSGLHDETIIRAGIESISVTQINRILDYQLPGLATAYKIPFSQNRFERYRLFYRPGEELLPDGKRKPKYIQQASTGNHLYFPVGVWGDVLEDTSAPIWITEGEKKALRGTQEGLPTVGITGLWNWKKKGRQELINDFDYIHLENRKVYVVPDSDWKSPNKHGYSKNLEKAVLGLCRGLQFFGAKTFIVDLSKLGGVR